MNRRSFLFFAVAVSTAGGIAGCASLGVTLTPAQVAEDAASIAGGLSNVVANLGAAAGLSAADIAAVATWAQTAQTAAAGVATTLTAAQAMPLVSQIATAVNAVVAILAKVPALPAPIPTILAAAQVLLPVLVTAVGIQLAASSAEDRAASQGMTAAQARAILGGAGLSRTGG